MGQPHFIKQWRKHRGLNQTQLAERIGMTQEHLSKVETGKRDYNQALLEAVAEALNCTPSDLLVRDPSRDDGIHSLWDTLKPAERVQAIKVIKAIRSTGTDG